MGKIWKKGRGKLGLVQPLLGSWTARAETPMGPVQCTRAFEPFLKGSYIRLIARWQFGAAAEKGAELRSDSPLAGKMYEEMALIGVNREGKVCFWSFTSDGKNSQGAVCDVSDVHKTAVGFEAQMPAGLARMVYWPDDGDGFFWAVESKNAKGWKRFTEHHYHPA
jgi:hypothetical protein